MRLLAEVPTPSKDTEGPAACGAGACLLSTNLYLGMQCACANMGDVRLSFCQPSYI